MIKYILSILFFLTASLSMAVESDTLSAPDVQDDTLVVAFPDTLTVVIGKTEIDTAAITAIEDFEKEREQLRQEIGTPGEVINVISFSKIFWTLVIIVLSYLIIRFVVKILETIAERSSKLRIGLKSIIPVVRILLWIFVVFIIIKGIYNPPKETYLAMWASAAIAIGLAAQDLLKNVFGGIMLLFDRPFQVGDKIETGKYYGEVIEIGLRATRIVTPDDSVVSVPNMELMNSSVSNANSGELNCQVVAEIYLPIDVDTQKARKIAIETAQVSRFIYLEKPIVVVFFNEVKERRSYLKMRIKAYVMDIRYEFQFKSDMTEIVIRELLQQGVIRKGDLF
ncbi:mechanosensitive ion channel family protein [Alkalitalea saponilacus]|uniref:Mechanosensitive ion channel n=1 Tax=Alkalitalea saponilacus TaxID=889453 RepID=A0A1T5HTH0_9BACT|nr:mechanosensitive ion channel domain-containing protein [Alkalitalea saponilacus]SKC23810.1 Mechanosensitive ion channel [Alkalitalea saponilacus]